MDGASNVMGLPGDRTTFDAYGMTLPMHNGPHPGYSSDVGAMLTPLEGLYQGMSGEELKSELDRVSSHMDSLIWGGKYHVVVR